MANILTVLEAATALRCEVTDQAMLDLLPGVDAYIREATGHDWAADATIHELAKSAARMLVVLMHENPGMYDAPAALNFGLRAALVQLEALAGRYFNFEGASSAGYIWLEGVSEGDTVSSVTGIVGISGSQAASFESVISLDGYIKQLSGSDLTDKWFRALIVPVRAV